MTDELLIMALGRDRMDPADLLQGGGHPVLAVVPPELRRGRFKAPDALIASLLRDASPSLR